MLKLNRQNYPEWQCLKKNLVRVLVFCLKLCPLLFWRKRYPVMICVFPSINYNHPYYTPYPSQPMNTKAIYYGHRLEKKEPSSGLNILPYPHYIELGPVGERDWNVAFRNFVQLYD